MRVPILETDEALTGAPPLRLFEPGQSLAKYDRQRTLIRARRAREDTGRPFFGREGSRAMFSTYQGGPFVEVFTPQVSARPAARHRISSEPALRMSEGEKYPMVAGSARQGREPSRALDRSPETRFSRAGPPRRSRNPRGGDPRAFSSRRDPNLPSRLPPRRAINTPFR